MTETPLKLASGWRTLPVMLVLLALLIATFTRGVTLSDEESLKALWIVGSLGGFLVWIFSQIGFIVISPNEAVVVQLFGEYVGTIKDVGFHYGNPFYKKRHISLRAHTFETGQSEMGETKDAAGNIVKHGDRHRQPSKVNDKDGTPIEIAAVVVWSVVNTADAVFQIDNYEEFVHVQSEAALRNLASQYTYDSHDDLDQSLRSHTVEVGERLKIELEDRLQRAGVHVHEARISYLAYAPEIAAAMLQRQQAAAVIAARQKIVEGAVGMVEMALDMLAQKQILELDAERKAAMVSNLLVVLCGDRNPQPVLNTGSIYS